MNTNYRYDSSFQTRKSREERKLTISDTLNLNNKRNLTRSLNIEKKKLLSPIQKNKEVEEFSRNNDMFSLEYEDSNKTFQIKQKLNLKKVTSNKIIPTTKQGNFRKNNFNQTFQINKKDNNNHLLFSSEKNKSKKKRKSKFNDIHHLNENNGKNDKKEDEEFYEETLSLKASFVSKEIGFFTRKGKISDKFEKPNNQDSYLYIDQFFNLKDCYLLGIMDGHGTNGHFVSQYIKTQAEEFFQNKENYFRNKNVEINLDNIQVRLQSKNFSLIKKFYKKVNSELPDTTFDTHFSGSTCNLVFKLGNTIICSNTGDSRAIIIKENKNINSQNNNQININNNNINNHNNLSNEHEKKIYNIFCNYEVEQLSYDHKPENKEEKERILEKGGCVYQCEDGSENGGPFRVWVKGESYPGLAMSRSLGDEVAESVGVIPDPDCIVKNINSNYKYIVIASDGLFEYLNNEDIMNIINPFFLIGDANGACKELGKKAAEEWEKYGEERDDITVMVLFIGSIHVKKETI